MAFLLPQLLTNSAKKFPDKEALRFGGEAVSYEALDRLTNQLARSLRDAGVKRGDRVGFLVNKSFGSVISVFGIMKAGGVYVPLDPNSPANRLAYITRNCGVRVLLTGSEKMSSVSEILLEGSPVKTVIGLDHEAAFEQILPHGAIGIPWALVEGQVPTPISDPGTIETDLAYILYTSGSTGEPKGVMISHRTILTFINWCFDTFELTPADRITSHAPMHFDLSTFDIYATIKAGGTVVLVPEKLSIFPIRLVQLLQEERISITYLVPSILSLIVNYGKLAKHDLSNLRIILFAGEVFPIKYLRELVKLVPHPAYYNLYGPTETNVCTYYKVEEKDLAPTENRPVPIGVACENMGIFVLDEAGNEVTEIGIEGELWARGPCVAQGYWADPEKTASRFLQYPLNQHYNEMVYRTGDIVVLDEDQENWRFVGRRDHMIKSRGYRIELGEIEAAVYAHPGILEAAVVAVPDPIITNRLIAFIVLRDGYEITIAEIKSHCGRHVPNYMVPENVEFRESLPKTSTGKVDRTLLVGS